MERPACRSRRARLTSSAWLLLRWTRVGHLFKLAGQVPQALAYSSDRRTLIVEAVEGPQSTDGCVVGFERCNDQMPCAQHDLYKPIRQRLKDYLRTTTLADMAASLRTKPSWLNAQQQLSTASRPTAEPKSRP